MLARLLFAIVCAVIGALLGESYISRLPSHAGYFLVPVEDRVVTAMPPSMRPRRTAFVVVDGLRRDAAERMGVVRALEAAGQCRISDQGTYTVSRPEYALLSTGLEVDRHGSRNNDLEAPLAAESVWGIAREAGLRVEGSSHLAWFQQLFPAGFDHFFLATSHADDVFAAASSADIVVYHPLYVDEAAHRFGAASPEHAAAVTRVDAEITRLLGRLDLAQDLVVLTADHGHRDAGGHGGAQPEIRNVLACFAGKNVARRQDRADLDGRATAPALAVLLGLRFPRHMRAGDDGLDVIPAIVEPRPELAPYLADRRAAVERFRAANRTALAGWLGGEPATWERLYAREARSQSIRGGAVVVALLAGLGIAARRRRLGREALARMAAWLALAVLAAWTTHHLILGDFDYTVINQRGRFIPRAIAIAALAWTVGLAAHRVVVRAKERLVGDHLTLLGALLGIDLGHVLVYGWPLGFPLPPAPLRYFPFFGAIALVIHALGTAIVIVVRRGEDSSLRAGNADDR